MRTNYKNTFTPTIFAYFASCDDKYGLLSEYTMHSDVDLAPDNEELTLLAAK
jgi:hypothetical protein